MNIINLHDIENMLGFKVENKIAENMKSFDFSYSELSIPERDKVILECLNQINSDLIKVGRHREKDWKLGWDENFLNFINSKLFVDLIPKYFGKYDIVRWKQNFIKPCSNDFEYNLVSVLIDSILYKFIDNEIENLYEFGCGTGHHLVRFSKYKNNLKYYGLDWAESSQIILDKIKDFNLVHNICGINFNYFDINEKINIDKNSVIYTVSSLEQVGNHYKDIVDYWISQKPSLCINFEIDSSLLDQQNLVDKLSILYAEKRNYLQGFYNYLEKLDRDNLIKIKYKKRLFYGSKFIEGFSAIVWQVL